MDCPQFPDEQKYSTKEMAQAAGVKVSRVRQWVDRGIIVPAYPGRGTGNRSFWTFENMVEVAVLKKLGDLGFSLERVSGLLDADALKNEPRSYLSKGGRI